MKRFFTLFTFFTFAFAMAQHKVADKVAEYKALHSQFTHFSVLTPSDQPADSNVARALKKSTLAQINTAAVNDIAAHQYETLEIEVPYQGNTILVELYKVNLFNQNFHVDTDKQQNISYSRGVYYRGIVKGDDSSIVSFNFFNNELNAIISAQGLNNLVVGKLDKSGNTDEYVIYSDADMRVPNGFNCNVKESNSAPVQQEGTNREVQTVHCVTMYLEIDHDLYLQNGSSTTQTNNWVTSVFNNVQTLYANDDINVALKSVFIWTDDDPYLELSSSESSTDYLYMFNQVRPVFDGDVGQLVGIDPNGLGGVADSINGLCSEENFSYSDVFFSYSSVPTFSWTVQVITHEFGHLLGSRHTHACAWNGNNTSIDGCGTQAGYTNEGNCGIGPIPTVQKGTIMSYCHLISGVGISFNNGFGPQPRQAIINAVEAAQCLSSDCINTCINTIVNVAVTYPTNNSATFTWDDLGNTASWQVSVSLFGSTVENWVTVNTNSYTTAGIFNPNTFYKVHIRPVCDSGLSNYRQAIFATPALWCNGVTITDTGGTNGEYTDNQTYIRTLIPSQPQKKIHLTFSAFDLEQDFDYLTVYDGPNVDAPLYGEYTGTFITSPIESSSPDGALTIKFFSDQGVTAAGYVATVTCTQNLGLDNFTRDIDFTYSPNPTTGSVSIISNTEMQDIAVYNVQGQLLYKSKNNGLDKFVDLSTFATGTYFFKLNFAGDKLVNFKVVKN